MRKLLLASAVLLLGACTEDVTVQQRRLAVADSCLQASNAVAAVTVMVQNDELNERQVATFEEAVNAVDLFCADQDATAATEMNRAGLTVAVRTLTNLLIRE